MLQQRFQPETRVCSLKKGWKVTSLKNSTAPFPRKEGGLQAGGLPWKPRLAAAPGVSKPLFQTPEEARGMKPGFVLFKEGLCPPQRTQILDC